jgi:hypothetical protein
VRGGHFATCSFICVFHDSRLQVTEAPGGGQAPLGDTRAEWTTEERRTTMLILVDGLFRVDLTECSAILAVQGDYLMWGPGIDHSWEALAPSIVVAIRWPSQPS